MAWRVSNEKFLRNVNWLYNLKLRAGYGEVGNSGIPPYQTLFTYFTNYYVNSLGQTIIDSIRQHHGTSIIQYFYEKARQKKGENAVSIDDFRYAGPKPQTRETGLVMLADVVEAASRTLDDPTPSRIQNLVKNLFNSILSDGQLDECELTLKDLHKIARSFDKILNGIHHHRIEYIEKRPAVGTNGRGKTGNGNPDKKPAKLVRDFTGKNRANGGGHLRRVRLP